MNNYPTVFIDESGVSDSPQNPQPYFGTGFLKVYNPDAVNRQLMQFNYAVRSQAKNLRKQLVQNLQTTNRPLNATTYTSMRHSFGLRYLRK